MRMMKQWFSRGFILPAAAVCALLVPCTAAQAALVQYAFTGTVGGANGALRSELPVGSSITGDFSFENTTPSTGTGRYVGALQSFSLNIGGYSVSLDPSGDLNLVRITNNPSGDLWRLRTSVTGDGIGQYSPTEFRLDLEDEDGLAITGTALQNPPSLGDLTSTHWRVVFEDAGGKMVRVQGVLNSLTAVPLPAAAVLFGIGLISLVGLGAGGLRNLHGSRSSEEVH
jgi:hypothetical protein